MLRDKLLGLSRRNKRILQLLADVLLIWLCLWLAFVLRVGFAEAWDRVQVHSWLFWLAPLVSLPIFITMGLYRAVMRYLGKEALQQIAKAVTFAALLLALAVYWFQEGVTPAIPRSFVFNYWILSLLVLGGLRLLMRQYFLGGWAGVGKHVAPFLGSDQGLPRVAVYGAGSAGNQLVQALRWASSAVSSPSWRCYSLLSTASFRSWE